MVLLVCVGVKMHGCGWDGVGVAIFVSFAWVVRAADGAGHTRLRRRRLLEIAAGEECGGVGLEDVAGVEWALDVVLRR